MPAHCGLTKNSGLARYSVLAYTTLPPPTAAPLAMNTSLNGVSLKIPRRPIVGAHRKRFRSQVVFA